MQGVVYVYKLCQTFLIAGNKNRRIRLIYAKDLARMN